jgi:hypothetical protein
VQDHVLKIRIAVVAVRAPAACAQINFHVAGSRLFVAKLNDRAAKIRAAFGIGKTGMKNANFLPVSRFEFAASNALMLSDGLEQIFRRQIISLAQDIHCPVARPPFCIKIFSPRSHPEIAFAPIMAQSQANKF